MRMATPRVAISGSRWHLREGNPLASVHIAANLLTGSNASSLVTIQFSEAVTGFDVSDLTATGGTLSPFSFQQIDGDTYAASFTANSKLRGHGAGDLDGGLHGPRSQSRHHRGYRHG